MKLGEKRGASIFQKNSTVADEPPTTEWAEESILKEVFIEAVPQESAETELAIPQMPSEEPTLPLPPVPAQPDRPVELGTRKNTHSVFFAPKSEHREFAPVLKEVQEYISENYAQLITDSSLADAKEQMKRYISKFVMEKRIAVVNMDSEQLIDALYTEMAEYGFLTKYL